MCLAGINNHKTLKLGYFLEPYENKINAHVTTLF